jgi:uncharacterized protein
VFKRIKKYFKIRKEKWESICKKCGLCCYNREIVKGKLEIKYYQPCEYLDTKTNLCTVYKYRFKICPECRKVTIFHAIFSRYMPQECGYVEKYRPGKKSVNTDTA